MTFDGPVSVWDAGRVFSSSLSFNSLSPDLAVLVFSFSASASLIFLDCLFNCLICVSNHLQCLMAGIFKDLFFRLFKNRPVSFSYFRINSARKINQQPRISVVFPVHFFFSVSRSWICFSKLSWLWPVIFLALLRIPEGKTYLGCDFKGKGSYRVFFLKAIKWFELL